jgi:hypothetical protein
MTVLEDAQDRARHVRVLFDDEVFKAGVFDLEESLILAWRKAKTVQDREAAHAEISALGSIMAKLRAVMERGAFEKEREKREEKQKSSTSIV